MSEQVGLKAVLDLAEFNRNYKQYQSSLNDMNRQTGSVANSLNQSFLGFGNSLWKLAGIMSTVVVAAAGAAGIAIGKMTVDAIQDAANLEAQISNIAAVLNLTNDEAGFLKDVIIDLGLDPTLKVTTFEAAQAMELLAKNGIFAGMSTDQMAIAAAEAGRAVVFLANATGADFGQAANIATSAMTLFGLETSQLEGIVSSVTAVTTNSKFTIHDYELALRNGGAAAAAFGVSLEDFNTVVAATADELGTGMRDGTSFANMLYRLTPNSEKAYAAMQQLGWITADGNNIFFDTNGNLKDMNEIAKILYNTLEGESKIMVEVGGRTAEQNKLLGELRTKYNSAQDTITEYTTGVKSMLASEDEKNKALEEAQRVLEVLGPEIASLESIQGTFTESTKQLTAEQKLLNIETIFGRDGLGATLGIMKEGAPIIDDVKRVMDALAVSEEEAFAIVSSGITEYELLQQTMARTDAEENAKTRMDNLKGSMEILGGIIEAVRIEIGDRFIPVLDKIVKRFTDWLTNAEPLKEQLINIGDAVAGFIDALFNGEEPLQAFSDMLLQIGGDELSGKFDEITTKIEEFITPIKTFVEEHSEGFITALEAIGLALAGMMIASAVAAGLSLLVNPVTILIGLASGLGVAWGENFLGIQDKADKAKESIEKFLEKLGLLESIQNLDFQAVFEQLPAALTTIQTMIVTWATELDWQALYDSFITAVGGLGATLGTAFNDIDWTVVGETIITGIGNAMILGAVLLTGAAKVIVDTLSTFIYSYITTVDWTQIVTEIGTGIQNGLSNVGDTASPFVEKLRTIQEAVNKLTFADIVSRLSAFYTKLTGGGLTEFLDNFTKIEAALEPIRAVLSSFSNAVLPTLKESWTMFMEMVNNYIIPLWGRLQETMESLSPIFDAIVWAIDRFVSAIAAGLGTVFVIIAGIVAGIVGGVARAITFTIGGFAAIVDGILLIIGGLADVLTGLWDIIVGIFTGNMDKIKEGFSKAGWGILDIIAGLFEGIAGIFVSSLVSLGAFIWGFVESVIAFFTNLYDELVGHSIIPDMVNDILEWILHLQYMFVQFIIDMILAVLTKFQTFVTDMVIKAIVLKDLILEKVRELWTKFITIITEKTLEILTKFGQFVLDLIAKLTEKATDFYNAGANIVQGIIDGITSKLMDAIGAIKGVAESVWNAWKDFWEEHSPSKLMMKSAENIMAGVKLGIENETSDVAGSIENAATDIFGSFLSRANDIIPSSGIRNPVQNLNNSNTTNNYNLNNSFAGNPQITDVDTMKLQLAGYR